jgi:3'-5' exoribonuclease
MPIKDLLKSAINTPISGNFIISDISLRPFAKKEGNFLSFKLADKTGKIDANIWQNTEHFYNIIKNDTVVTVTGSIKAFDGKNQISVETMVSCEIYDSSELVACSAYDPDILFKQLINILQVEIKDDYLKIIVNMYLKNPKFVENFKRCPGGKGGVHHAYIGGLLEHTLAVLKTCLSIADNYQFEDINRGILAVGAFLHDIGKLEAYEYSPLIKMTDRGRLLGHLPLGYEKFCKDVDAEIELYMKNKKEDFRVGMGRFKMLIGHLILSHHGSYEFETCRLPQTLEALILSKADDLDATVIRIAQVIEEIPNDWSAWDNLSKRMYFKANVG